MRLIKKIRKNFVCSFVVSLFAVGGILSYQNSYATTAPLSVEPENGIFSAPVSVRSGEFVSNGQYVRFGPELVIKPPLKGLFDRKSLPPVTHHDALGGWVIDAKWSMLQLTADGPIESNNVIDQAIADVRAINSADPDRDMQLKIRIFAGQHAPGWAKTLDGPAVTVDDPVDGGSALIGKFWTSNFREAYDGYISKLAEKYDSIPEIREVTVSRCMTVYAEPYIRQIASATTVQSLRSAGYTLEADKQCQREQIDAHSVWKTTRSSVAYSPYQAIYASTVGTDTVFTNEMIDYCRTSLGERCVVENNSIGWPLKTVGGYSAMYEKIITSGKPITFQTETACKIDDWRGTLEWAATTAKAYAVELPSANCIKDGITYYGYKNVESWPIDELRVFNERFRAEP